MAVPVCPDCGTTIEPDWDWCQACGFDPEGVRPADWTPRVGALSVFPSAEDAPPPPPPPPSAAPAAGTKAERPPSALRPHDLLRPRADAPASVDALTGPMLAPEPETDHRPLTLDDLRRTTGVGASASTATPDVAEPAAPDRFSASMERLRAPTPPGGGGRSAPPVDDRPPLFPAPPVAAVPVADLAPDTDTDLGTGSGGGISFDADLDPDDRSAGGPGLGADTEDSHPYFDLPYDDPSPAPGSEPEPEPASRLRRRRPAADPRPNAASMAMAAGRIPADPSVVGAAPSSTLPPPPPPPPGARAATTTESAPPSIEPAPAPADSSSLGPLVFGPSGTPTPMVGKPPKRKSSPLSVAAILMTIAIAVIVLWPTYQDLSKGESGPALPPPSAGAIGYAPAGADGARPAVDPQRTASWATSSPAGAGFEVDMPGVVIIRNTTVPLASGTANAVVASSSTGRGGYVVAAMTAPSDAPWTSVQQASDAILAGFKNQTGNDLKAGAATTLGGQPALALTGNVDGVPSEGAIVLIGNRAFLAVAGDAPTPDLTRFLSSFQPTA